MQAEDNNEHLQQRQWLILQLEMYIFISEKAKNSDPFLS